MANWFLFSWIMIIFFFLFASFSRLLGTPGSQLMLLLRSRLLSLLIVMTLLLVFLLLLLEVVCSGFLIVDFLLRFD